MHCSRNSFEELNAAAEPFQPRSAAAAAYNSPHHQQRSDSPCNTNFLSEQGFAGRYKKAPPPGHPSASYTVDELPMQAAERKQAGVDALGADRFEERELGPMADPLVVRHIPRPRHAHAPPRRTRSLR